ncbi:autoinducer binding domain-containing protein [Bradyrhizobium tunisiense]|uniref:autoinducer binding domain-containing protein n=1 Tax=Bradyrhizobium tunisiense TaxID=3278709 RepID=UPI0035DBCE78
MLTGSPAADALFEEAAKFGIRCGFTFPIHDEKCTVAALSFATDERRPDFERSLVQHAQSLRLIARFFHAHAKRFWTSDRMVSGVVLSPREYECLEWSARGKSAGEIGTIIGRRIVNCTVEGTVPIRRAISRDGIPADFNLITSRTWRIASLSAGI